MAYVHPLDSRFIRRGVHVLAARGWLVCICLAFLVIVVVMAIAAPLLAPYSPTGINLLQLSQGPSAQHLLGTDELGRDLLSRIIYGARDPLLGASLVVLIATTLGTGLAIASAWRGGVLDSIVSRTFDIGFAFPGLLLAIIAVAVFGPGFIAPVLALALAYTPYIGRLVRGAAIRERSLPYIEACSVQGFSAWTICRRHILRNLLPFVNVQATVSFAYALIDLASLSFLGLGVQPPTADWGLMVAEGQPAILAHHPQQSIFTGVLIVLTVLSVIVVGERIGEGHAGAPL
jgi:peptide/nickel transport system permease protein